MQSTLCLRHPRFYLSDGTRERMLETKSGKSRKQKTVLLTGAAVLFAAALLFAVQDGSDRAPALDAPETHAERLKAGETLKIQGSRQLFSLNDGSRISVSFDKLAIVPKKTGPVILGKLKTLKIDGLTILADYRKDSKMPVEPFGGMTQQLRYLENSLPAGSLKDMILMEINLRNVHAEYRLNGEELMSLRADAIKFRPSVSVCKARGGVRLLYDGKTYRSEAADWDAEEMTLLFFGETEVSYGTTVEMKEGVQVSFHQPGEVQNDPTAPLEVERKKSRKGFGRKR